MRVTSTVKWFDVAKGWGFITSPEGEDVFVHYKDIMAEGFKRLDEGQTVSYLQVKSNKGWSAKEVEVLHENQR